MGYEAEGALARQLDGMPITGKSRPLASKIGPGLNFSSSTWEGGVVGDFLPLSVPQFPHMQNGIITEATFPGQDCCVGYRRPEGI